MFYENGLSISNERVFEISAHQSKINSLL